MGNARPSRPGVASLAAAIVARGRAAWPDLELDQASVEDHLMALPVLPPPTHATDLFLAWACGRGDRNALARFEAGFMHTVPAQVRHLGRTSDFGDEVSQRLRVRLLTAAPGVPPRIATYGGRGPLAGWVRAAAVRVALDLVRERAPGSGPDPRSLELLVGEHDPELAFLKAHHRAMFATALQESLAALSERDRTTLRLHLCAGLSAVRIAAVMGVNHATVSRWLVAARTAIFTDTRRRLSERLSLGPGEFESLVRLVQSQLDVSVARVLDVDEAPRP